MTDLATGAHTGQTLGPIAAYQAQLAAGNLRADPLQEEVVAKLQTLSDRIIVQAALAKPKKGLGRFFSRKKGGQAPIDGTVGLYVYGGVGRGKSMLMDLFFDTLPDMPNLPKKRVHFHEFMLVVHAMVHEFRKASATERAENWGMRWRGTDDPIPPVAARIASEAKVLCFDELQVTNVADAMIISRLFGTLLEEGVWTVITSNRVPSDLYIGGHNRQLFLPFIATLEQRLDILELDSPTDYRLDRLKGVETYHAPLDEGARAAVDAAWLRLTDQVGGEALALETHGAGGRMVIVPCSAKGVARFSFNDLCAKPLGSADYLTIANRHHTVLVDDIPELSPEKRNEAKRFVTLIDVLYEHNVKLICSAAAQPEVLYPRGHGAFEFERTVSRLMEMQSEDYLARGHGVADDIEDA